MASNPPKACCTRGFKHQGQPAGEMRDIGVSAYFSEPQSRSQTNTAVIIQTDIFGLYENTKLLADEFAAEGYLAVVPDLFDGSAVKFIEIDAGEFDLQQWLPNHTPEHIDPIISLVIRYLRQDLGITRIGSAGYCFGAKYACRFLRPGNLDVAFLAHPSFVTEEEVRNIEGPISIAAAERDSIFTPNLRHRSEDILSTTQVSWQLNLYGKIEHGFALRGDLNDPHQLWSKEQAFYQAISWFRRHL